jgi:mono/diheme cytochrome c family protein
MPTSPIFRVVKFSLAVILASLLWSWTQVSAQSSDSDLQRGAFLFAENCAVCHGPNGEGRIGAKLAKDWPSIQPDQQIKTTVENGLPGTTMPAWSKAKGGPFSDEDINSIVAYILSWQTGTAPPVPTRIPSSPRPPITPPANVEGDPNRGAMVFDENCILCHGPNGEGRLAPRLQIDWASNRPDLLVKSIVENGIAGSTMPAWSQEKGGPLTKEEIKDTVAFLITLQNQPSAIRPPTPTTSLPEVTVSQGIFLGGICLVVFIIFVAVIIVTQKRRTEKPTSP